MNKKITLAKIQNLANELDNQGLFKEADSLTQVMVKIAANVVDVANLPTESDETGETLITVNNEKIQVPRINISRSDWREEYLRSLGFHAYLKQFLKII